MGKNRVYAMKFLSRCEYVIKSKKLINNIKGIVQPTRAPYRHTLDSINAVALQNGVVFFAIALHLNFNFFFHAFG